jgi:hypothetical protein
MLDPTRFALDAATVGFRKRMRQSVDWGAFNQALQTETDSIKVRRELEETPITELHVMGAQRFGLEGNGKTNEYARQQRQMNGYVLRSFLADGGPIIKPQPNNNQLLGIPTTFGQTQYTPNAVLGQQYTSAFTEPLNEPLENNTILLGRAGIQAKSDSLTNPYKALQFQLNIGASQDQIRQVEQDHNDKRDAAFQRDLARQIEIQNAPVNLRPIVSLLQQRDEMASRGVPRRPTRPPPPPRRPPREPYDESMSSGESKGEENSTKTPTRERQAQDILSRSRQSDVQSSYSTDAYNLQNEFAVSEGYALYALLAADDDYEEARNYIRNEIAGRNRSETVNVSRIESALGSYYGSPVTAEQTVYASELDRLFETADEPSQYSATGFNSSIGSVIDRVNITPLVTVRGSNLVLDDTGVPVSAPGSGGYRPGVSPYAFFTPGATQDGSTLMAEASPNFPGTPITPIRGDTTQVMRTILGAETMRSNVDTSNIIGYTPGRRFRDELAALQSGSRTNLGREFTTAAASSKKK